VLKFAAADRRADTVGVCGGIGVLGAPLGLPLGIVDTLTLRAFAVQHTEVERLAARRLAFRASSTAILAVNLRKTVKVGVARIETSLVVRNVPVAGKQQVLVLFTLGVLVVVAFPVKRLQIGAIVAVALLWHADARALGAVAAQRVDPSRSGTCRRVVHSGHVGLCHVRRVVCQLTHKLRTKLVDRHVDVFFLFSVSVVIDLGWHEEICMFVENTKRQ